MFSNTFKGATCISSQSELRALFRSDCLYLQEGGSITFSGEIVLGPNVVFGGKNSISGPITIEIGSVLIDVQFGEGNRVRAHSLLSNIVAGRGNLFGPFCFIRDGCTVGDNSILGAHLEATRSRFGSNVKISHRAFVGDTELGNNTIVGAGVVFCNYDGAQRQSTKVGTNVTIGSGSLVVPPITIGDDVIIAAGSVITKSVLAGSKIVQKR